MSIQCDIYITYGFGLLDCPRSSVRSASKPRHRRAVRVLAPVAVRNFGGMRAVSAGRGCAVDAQSSDLECDPFRVTGPRRGNRSPETVNDNRPWFPSKLRLQLPRYRCWRPTQLSSVCGTQPIFGAIDSTAAHNDGYSPRGSCTIRTVRSRTSGDNFFDLFMAPSSQELEPRENVGRFTAGHCQLDRCIDA